MSTIKTSLNLGETIGQLGPGEAGSAFECDEPFLSAGIRYTKSGNTTRYRLVKNSSGGVLLPCRIVKYQAGARGLEVGGYSTAKGDWAGVVDSLLPISGVADGRYFWIAESGPTEVLTPGVNLAAAIAANDPLVSGANGFLDKAGATVEDVRYMVGFSDAAIAVDDINAKFRVMLKSLSF